MSRRTALTLFLAVLGTLALVHSSRRGLKSIATYSEGSYFIADNQVDSNGNMHILYQASSNFTIGSQTFFVHKSSYIFVLVKYAPDLETVLWAAGPSSASSVYPVNIRLTTDGVVVTTSMLVGTLEIGTQTFTNVDTTDGGKIDVVVVKYNSNGNFQWATHVKGGGWGEAEETYILPDDSVVLVVYTQERTVSIGATVLFTSTKFLPYREYYYLLKLTAQGAFGWVQHMDNSDNTLKSSGVHNGYLYICGFINSNQTPRSLTLGGITISPAKTYGYCARVKVSDGSVSYLKAMEASSGFLLHRLVVTSSGLHLIGDFGANSTIQSTSYTVPGRALAFVRAVLATGELDQHQVVSSNATINYLTSVLNDEGDLYMIAKYAGSVQNMPFTTPESKGFASTHLITKYSPATNTFSNWAVTFRDTSFNTPATITNWNYFGNGLIFTVAPSETSIEIAGTTVTRRGGAIFKISGEDGSVQWAKTFQTSGFSSSIYFNNLLLDREQEILHMAFSFGNGLTSFDSYSYPQTTTSNSRSLIATLSPSGDFTWVSSLFHATSFSISSMFQNDIGEIIFVGGGYTSQSPAQLKIGRIVRPLNRVGGFTRHGIFSNSTTLCSEVVVNQCTTCLDESTCAICTGSKYIGDLCHLVDANCNGKHSTSSQVCSGRGDCVGTDTCRCRVGWAGFNCQRICSYCVRF